MSIGRRREVLGTYLVHGDKEDTHDGGTSQTPESKAMWVHVLRVISLDDDFCASVIGSWVTSGGDGVARFALGVACERGGFLVC